MGKLGEGSRPPTGGMNEVPRYGSGGLPSVGPASEGHITDFRRLPSDTSGPRILGDIPALRTNPVRPPAVRRVDADASHPSSDVPSTAEADTGSSSKRISARPAKESELPALPGTAKANVVHDAKNPPEPTKNPKAPSEIEITQTHQHTLVLNTAHPDQAALDLAKTHIPEGITGWPDAGVNADHTDRHYHVDSLDNPQLFIKVTPDPSYSVLPEPILGFHEIEVAPRIREVIQTPEAQEIAKRHGFASIDVVMPLASIKNNITGEHTMVYPWQAGKSVDLETSGPLQASVANIDEFALKLEALLLDRHIIPADLDASQVMVHKTPDGKKHLRLIDTEHYRYIAPLDQPETSKAPPITTPARLAILALDRTTVAHDIDLVPGADADFAPEHAPVAGEFSLVLKNKEGEPLAHAGFTIDRKNRRVVIENPAEPMPPDQLSASGAAALEKRGWREELVTTIGGLARALGVDLVAISEKNHPGIDRKPTKDTMDTVYKAAGLVRNPDGNYHFQIIPPNILPNTNPDLNSGSNVVDTLHEKLPLWDIMVKESQKPRETDGSFGPDEKLEWLQKVDPTLHGILTSGARIDFAALPSIDPKVVQDACKILFAGSDVATSATLRQTMAGVLQGLRQPPGSKDFLQAMQGAVIIIKQTGEL